MKTVDQLVNSVGNKKLGNHRVETDGNIKRFYYYWTNIFTVNLNTNEFVADNGGFNTSSTTRAINAYVREFKSMGYQAVGEIK